MVEVHWLWRGFQSALYLYVSCVPCHEAAYKRRRRRDAKRDRRRNEEMAEYHAEQGHRPQPVPFDTNKHWGEEIKLGPGPPQRKNRKNAKRDIRSAASNHSTAECSVTELPRAESAASARPKSSLRFQRPDEEFAYLSDLEEVDNSIQKPQKAYYFPARAPPINDIHPPSTSTVPARRSERAWMKMAPPTAEFMSGKKGVTKVSRSGTGGSSVVNAPPVDKSLEKKMGQKIMENKARRGQGQSDRERTLQVRGMDASPSRTASNSPARSTPRKARKRPRPLRLDSSSSSETEVLASVDSNILAIPQRDGDASPRHSIPKNGRIGLPLKVKQQNIRPPLFTTRSAESPSRISRSTANNENMRPDSSTPPSTSLSPLSPRSSISMPSGSASPRTRSPTKPLATDNYTPSPRKRKDTKLDNASGRPRIYLKDSSLNVLQDLVEPSTLLNSKFIRSPTIESKIPLPVGSGDSVTDMWIGEPVEEETAWIPPPKRWSTGGLVIEH